jgi:Family of unknown function (DUF5678)
MDRQTFDREAALNRKAYEALREQIRREHAGKYVAFAQGRVIAVASTYDEAEKIVDGLRPKPEYCLIFPAELEPSFDLAYDL